MEHTVGRYNIPFTVLKMLLMRRKIYLIILSIISSIFLYFISDSKKILFIIR